MRHSGRRRKSIVGLLVKDLVPNSCSQLNSYGSNPYISTAKHMFYMQRFPGSIPGVSIKKALYVSDNKVSSKEAFYILICSRQCTIG